MDPFESIESLLWIWGGVAIGVVAVAIFFVLVLRVAPRRGFWNQPAAALRAPGSAMRAGLYATALAHLCLGAVAVVAIDHHRAALAIVVLLASGFYVACAEVARLATPARRVSGTL